MTKSKSARSGDLENSSQLYFSVCGFIVAWKQVGRRKETQIILVLESHLKKNQSELYTHILSLDINAFVPLSSANCIKRLKQQIGTANESHGMSRLATLVTLCLMQCA